MKQRAWPVLTIWAVLLVGSVLTLGVLLVFTFGTVCFAGLFMLWLRGWKKNRREPQYLINGGLLLLCLLWFAVNILVEFAGTGEARAGLFALAFLFPPLIAHLYYLEAAEFTGPATRWKAVIAFLYAAGVGSALCVALLLYGLFPLSLDRVVWPLMLLLGALGGDGFLPALPPGTRQFGLPQGGDSAHRRARSGQAL
ncbi:MAG: hypothetical protein ACE5JX_07660 [Acidobacteriota bacterium]